MQHVRVHVTAGGREAEIHPMYDVWANAPFIERATALQWNFTGDALGILHYAVGDADAFEAAAAEIGGLDATAATVETHLSERQREAIEAAVELDYYGIPREADHEDVATVLDCAPSTAAEHLRKAESKLVSATFGT